MIARRGLLLLALLFVLAAYSAMYFGVFCGPKNSAWFLCNECPDGAVCEDASFTCSNEKFPFGRICAEPGAVITSYNATLSMYYYDLQMAIYRIVEKEPMTAEMVRDKLAKSEDKTLRALNAADIVTLWTYEGDYYYIDNNGILMPYSRIGISPLIAMICAGFAAIGSLMLR